MISIKRILYGLIFIGVGIIIASLELGSTSAILFIIAGALFLLFSRVKAKYCADCGQFLGGGWNFSLPCPRCGCNIWTDYYNGVGKTRRNR